MSGGVFGIMALNNLCAFEGTMTILNNLSVYSVIITIKATNKTLKQTLDYLHHYLLEYV